MSLLKPHSFELCKPYYWSAKLQFALSLLDQNLAIPQKALQLKLEKLLIALFLNIFAEELIESKDCL